jgi:hypothetical protein
MSRYWFANLQTNVLPRLRGEQALRLAYLLLLRTGDVRLVYRATRLLCRVLFLSKSGALRDEIEARFFSRTPY